ncbi:MAG: ATPase [Candidatus Dadabacteria bacterium RIFCSPHIGHO2_12_FULL_53_21]|nr:MAG: ATPase [Candidatus Dadabacteria bacterium RIFCSPHIGHO2_12_FULL_53_21]
MKTAQDLRDALRIIDGRGYASYKDIAGEYGFDDFILYIDRVQGDPFASPSRVRVRVYQDIAGFPKDTYTGKSRETALRDYIARAFNAAAERFSLGNRGSGGSGLITMSRPGQEILERSSVVFTHLYAEARFGMGLPAFGRTVAGKHAHAMFFEELPRIVRFSLVFGNLDGDALYRHIETAEDADFLRNEIEGLGCVSFIAEGSVLPRASGIDPGPMSADEAVPFESPPSLRMDVELPNRGQITGMGIPKGVTLIVGGGYHGKSTLLEAVSEGIYNHVPGDGREFVVTNPNAVRIRAEDGRRIEKVDISPFISNLPYGKDTKSFSTEDASGSTSQAANILESLEAGAHVLLIDEDTSATNFMIRDHRMQELVSKDREPITPFIDMVRSLYTDQRVSTVLVMGGSGDYFDVADHVICMTDYKSSDVTAEALGIAKQFASERKKEGGGPLGRVTDRIPLSGSLDPRKGKKDVKISAKGLRSIHYGRQKIDLHAVEQLTDICQTAAIGDAIEYARRYMDGKRTLREITSLVMMDIARDGLDVIGIRISGGYAEFRKIELAAAINRLRTLEVEQK